MKEKLLDLIRVYYDFSDTKLVAAEEEVDKFIAELDDILDWDKEAQDEEELLPIDRL